ncbi:hypothetical protein ACXVWQ_10855, partial [Haemophilus sp. SZY H57]
RAIIYPLSNYTNPSENYTEDLSKFLSFENLEKPPDRILVKPKQDKSFLSTTLFHSCMFEVKSYKPHIAMINDIH